ncbi:hypothetical protein K439DRAFT_1349568 [Ramaria rubella]|nr:hypothetical protein K439DRAFT_1349568 [Ramaria rubella]
MQYVYIGGKEQYNIVEFGPQTRARDILDLMDAQGELQGHAADEPGEWMLWEVANIDKELEIGKQRPLRDYELPIEVYASWNSDKPGRFLIKKTNLAFKLSREAMPKSSPILSGYVQWESKHGKWNKRWMELREHSLWLSKRDNGKDSTFLCSLSNFDCYYVQRTSKSSKAFSFAVKSTDNPTLFENQADYMHVFECDRSQGQQWIECIMLARSYVLHKERTILFSNASATKDHYSYNQKTNRVPASSRTIGPLVDVNAMQAHTGETSTRKNLFQSGSLLAKSSR